MAAVTLSMGKLVALLVIAILASSAISIGASTMLAVGPAGLQGEQGETGPQGPKGDTGPQGEPGLGIEPSGYISIPAAAFVESDSTYDTNIGLNLRNMIVKTYGSVGRFSFLMELPLQMLLHTGMMTMPSWM